jgi:hypothetical protein
MPRAHTKKLVHNQGDVHDMTPSLGTVAFVHQLRPLPYIDEQLDWFFNQAECDMGLSSNFERALGIDSTSSRRTPEDAAEAAHRYRRIRTWLKAIADSDAGVLQAAYEVRNWPVALFDELGRLTGIVVRLACALDSVHADRRLQQTIEMTRAQWLASSGDLRRNPTLARLRRDAEARFVRAHQAYARVCGQVGRRLP